MQARYQATLQPEQKKGQLAATGETRQERFSPVEDWLYGNIHAISVEILGQAMRGLVRI
jgi:hypothetical protein